MGSRTGCRVTTPGASRSTGRVCVVAIGPLSSIGWPSEFTTRPIIASPTGTLRIFPERLTWSPSRSSVYSPISTAPTWSSSRLMRQSRDAMRKVQQFAGHHLVQAMQARNAVTQRDDRADFIHADLRVVICDLLLQELCNFICVYLSHASLF